MPYTPPIIQPSGTTFAQFRAGGFRGQLERLANANALAPAVRSLVLGPFERIQAGIAHAVDSFLQGDPVSTTDINAKLLAYATALRALATALDEVNALVSANPGTLTKVSRPGNTVHETRRTFP